ncbi:pyridoxamine 5'-phosphate oxidase family protein [Neobacillus notoginsengisoli]|uniref:Pyridoxamine 5'-phosphate oxidase family protein n=1 Tax=Neobacillus notoginsengisoli TaxID=1578198 RepID=A0A417YWW4_9BACI|nr:MSMEG_1061 family FMN-dependent PPOX-type flavoprotein [Neobacillus notoginsengisoli]RHW42019.1 pyridoxamine 5'-phosphate oxidase family protein [Neobacillus notoginsengisoli]
MFKNIITAEEQFQELQQEIGLPSERSAKKVKRKLDEQAKKFIVKSPFLTLATSNADGRCDVSPKGDAPGFVCILDDNHLFIPERRGNRRMDSVQNILSNANVGLLFLVPGMEEGLRVNGQAFICRDPELLEKTAADGVPPLFGIGVKVEECFSHYSKAFYRSGLWESESSKKSKVESV